MNKLLLALASFYFSTNGFLVRYSEIDPVSCYCVFAVVLTLCASVFQLLKRARKWDQTGTKKRKQIKLSTVFILPLLFFSSKVSATMAFQFSPISTVVPVYFVWAPLAFILDLAYTKTKRLPQPKISKEIIIGHLSVLIGIFILANSDNLNTNSLQGIALILCAALFTAVRLVYLKNLDAQNKSSDSADDTVFMQIWVSGVACAVFSLNNKIQVSTETLYLWIVYSIGTFITYISFYTSFFKLNVGEATGISVVELIFASLLGFLAGEWNHSYKIRKILGVLLVGVGFLTGLLQN